MHPVVAPGERTLNDLDYSDWRIRHGALCPAPHGEACAATDEGLHFQPLALGDYLV